MRMARIPTIASFALVVAGVSMQAGASPSTNVWKGTYAVQEHRRTGTMVLQEGKLPGYVDYVQGIIGTLTVKSGPRTVYTCTLSGPKSSSVRSDRILLSGECDRRGRRFFHTYYLARGGNQIHGYYTASTSKPSSGGILGAEEQDFSKLSYTKAFWGVEN